MAVGRLEFARVCCVIIRCALLAVGSGAAKSTLRKLEIGRVSCDELAAVERPEQREKASAST